MLPQSVRYCSANWFFVRLRDRCGAVCSAADYTARLPEPAAAAVRREVRLRVR
jgi:hypothetical protein